jgi:FtsP/CotA-like multicopper oxidase with cupredoxin domain
MMPLSARIRKRVRSVFVIFQTISRVVRPHRRFAGAVTLGVAALLHDPAVRAARDPMHVQQAGWKTGLSLPDVVDLNPDPHILEIAMDARIASVEISPGVRVEAWTYNGGMPGPLIRLRVGDRLIVHFTNRLPQPTTVHWHGLRIPIHMDGVPGHSQPEVKPGESFTYDFAVPDAGLFWYHPHVMSAAQVGFGLYGALLVDDPNEHVATSDELVLVLSDIALTEDGRQDSPDSGGTAGTVFGREGEHVLVNGRERPRLTARVGAPQRWRIVNAAKSRYFNLDLEGQRFTIIGSDGGLLEYPINSERILLPPGQRADVIVSPSGSAGTDLILQSRLHNRGYGSIEFRDEPELMAIGLAGGPPHTGEPLPRISRAIEPLATGGATPVAVNLTLDMKSDDFVFGIDNVPFAHNRPVKARLGETQVWTIANKTKWSHPFHLHGFFFQVLDENGTPVRPLAWRDTVDVPLESSIRIAVRFDDRPGAWMYHCHILDHADHGLMGMIELGGADHRHRN